MNRLLPWAGLAAVLLAILFALYAGWHLWRSRRRDHALHDLVEGADSLEAAIRECRQRLAHAHDSVRVAPGIVPAPGSAAAAQAIDEALRGLLAHRLWIRDHANRATQAQLDKAVAALDKAKAEMAQQLTGLDEAQRELDEVLQEQVDPEATRQ